MITGIVLLAVMLLGSGLAVFFTWRASIIPWVKLTTPARITVAYLLPKGEDPRRLAAAVDLAYVALANVWPAPAVHATISTLQIFVVNGLTWKNIAGQTVGGEQDGRIIKVPKDLSSLAHEIAHACEFDIDKRVDETHEKWATNGITSADEKFRGQLANLKVEVSAS